MSSRIATPSLWAAAFVVINFWFCTTSAQPARSERGSGQQGPRVLSPEVASDCKVHFRIVAPKAETVRLSGGDIPGNGQGAEMTKDTNGVWEVVLGPIPPGAYRYNFNVDGVPVIDPRNPTTSEIGRAHV